MHLPLPIAALCRRANNEKSAKARHDTTYFAWEASVRLAVAAQSSSASSEPLVALRAPSTGIWVRAMVTRAGILDAEAILNAYALMTEVGAGKARSPSAITARQLIDALPGYRNQVIGHGSTRSARFYDDAYDRLMNALTEAWSADVFWPRGTTLVYVESIAVTQNGRRDGRVFALTGHAATVEARGRVAVPEPVLPRRVYVRRDQHYHSAHPWLLFEQSELGEHVWFFNGRKRRAQYLDYARGASLRGRALIDAFPDIERDLDTVLSRSGEASADADSATESEASGDPDRYDDYRILDRLGEGGMGVVYRARHDSLDRTVALKTLPSGAAEDAVALARFKREIASLARCEHPNVVKILSSGSAHGSHYYTMELVDGDDLSALATEAASAGNAAPTSPERIREVAAMFRDAALGVQHLHEQGIIHRDIKPANLMLTRGEQSAHRRIVVMDLGLAAIGDASMSITRDRSAILGTLRYMPPEQLQRNLLALDRRADVYSLGATFYEVLCGRPVFDGDSEARLIQQVLHEEPDDPRALNPGLPADLAAILRKAISKDARLRYDTAAALAADIDAWMSGQAISARPPTLSYMLALSVRRHKAIAATVLVAALALVIGAVLFLDRERSLRRAADRHAERADRAAREARENALEANQTLRLAQRHAAEAYASAALARNALRLASAREHDDDPTLVLALLRELEPTRQPAPGWSRLVRRALYQGVAQAVLRGHRGGLNAAAFSPDGTRIVTASSDKSAWIWTADGSAEPIVLAGHGGTVNHAAFSSDGSRVVTAANDTTARIWQAADGRLSTALVGHQNAVMSAAFSPDSTRVVTASRDGTVRVWRADGSGQPIVFDGHLGEVFSAAFSPDGTRVVSGSNDKTARIVRTDGSGRPLVLRGHRGAVTSAAFSPDGRRIVTASNDRTARVWNADGSGAAVELVGHRRHVFSAAFSPDGQRVVTASWDGSARIFRADGHGRPRELIGHRDSVNAASFSPDGRLVITASWDRTARVWNVAGTATPSASPSDRPVYLSGHRGALTAAVFSPDNQRVITTSSDNTARIFRADGASPPIVLTGHTQQVYSAAFSPDGAHVVTASLDRTARIWRADLAGPPLRSFTHSAKLHAAAFSPDGTRIVTAMQDGTLNIHSADGTGAPIVFTGHQGAVNTAVFSPDGTRLVSASDDKTARVVRADGSGPAIALTGHQDAVNSAVFSPDGRRVITASSDHTVRVWSADGIGEPIVLTGHSARVASAACAGARGGHACTAIVSISSDKTLRVWTLADERASHPDHSPEAAPAAAEVLVIPELEASTAAFSPDGSRVVTTSHSARDPLTGDVDHWATIWPALEPFAGADDPALWRATTYCPSIARRIEVLGDSADRAASELRACRQRVQAAGASAP